MIRLSVTHLDAYRYWLDSDNELSELITDLKGAEETPAMRAGKAFHKLLEEASDGDIRSAEVGGLEFDFALDAQLALPPVRELKAEMIFKTPSGSVTLVGKVDCINGKIVRDYKLTERFDMERYTDSYQWRSYLTIFNAWTFVYDVFVARYDLPRVIVYDYHTFEFHAYPGMREDVEREVCALAEIVAKHVPELIKKAA